MLYYEVEVSREQVDSIPCQTELSKEKVFNIIKEMIR